jgi:hypothetical protein
MIERRAFTSSRDRRASKRKRDEAQQTKIDEARRRLLAGAVVLAKVELGEINEAQFRKWLDSALTDPEDRALFSL